MLVPTSAIIEQAVAGGTGVGAFNVITLEHAEGIVTGAETVGQPVVLQVSQNCVKFHGGHLLPIARAAAAVAAESSVPVALHLDHVEDEVLLRQAADAGFASVMVDASKMPYAQNVAATREAARWAHRVGLWVEAELGEVGGKNGAHAPGVRTSPRDAARFVSETGVDALAVAVGSSHAMTTQTASLDMGLISRIRSNVPVPLVLHGSSGVPDDQLCDAVRHGMVKINIGTALNVAFTETIQNSDLRIADPRTYLAPAREAIAHTVAHLLGVLSSA
ncbi:class II fructose-bisphosphate aldolase [Kibdelosporangium philippinense]|uniref:Class II fructose-bisphosphate aldolase n=2 Tax=Kibdelosporangium philippinense TaxID=211113 RepID=A0ABS8ZE20_9PSEU|nr:class II fructose-bisphosphate aldolase [Kibdelosporangium philippinense]MCE7004077.1 class II fructose-bisphosphate aldolase [Kibdelosporangium philippinense]